MDSLTLEDGTDGLYINVGHVTTNIRYVTSQNSEDLKLDSRSNVTVVIRVA